MQEENKGKKSIKDYIIVVLILIILGLVCYISFLSNNSESTTKVESLSPSETTHEESTTSTIINKIESVQIPTINYNEMQKKDDSYELTVKSSKFGKIIEPPNTSSYYRYYEASDNQQYLEIVFDYKNLTANSLRADKISSIKIKYNDKYEYTGFAVIEDGEGDFTYSNITSIAPLSTGKMHYLIEVPNEVANDTSSIVATITCDQDSYQLKIR